MNFEQLRTLRQKKALISMLQLTIRRYEILLSNETIEMTEQDYEHFVTLGAYLEEVCRWGEDEVSQIAGPATP